jgi:hypothetical protein
MAERGMDRAMIADTIDTGSLKDAGKSHFWIYKHIAGRDDNLLCVAAVINNVVVVKTVMHHWEPTP